MKLIIRGMAVLGTVVVIAVIVALVTPKTAHAIVATMVDVVNTPSQPVPVQSVPTATTLVDSESILLSDGGFLTAGPFDISSYSSIRFVADPFNRNPLTIQFSLISVDANGNQILLDSLTSNTQGLPITAVYPTPGTGLLVKVNAVCTLAPCGDTTVKFDIFGR